MPTIAAKNALTSMWPMLHAARDRSLTGSELTELRRLCDVLAQGFPGREAFADKAEQLCLSIHSSGIFEGRTVRSADRLLEYIDELRMMLE